MNDTMVLSGLRVTPQSRLTSCNNMNVFVATVEQEVGQSPKHITKLRKIMERSVGEKYPPTRILFVKPTIH